MFKGFEKQWDFLRRSFETEKIPHAIMFCGEGFIDKKALALEFAKFINCSSKKDSEKPCGVCESCKDQKKGVHSDFLMVEPQESGEIQISQIRDLIWRLSLKSYFDSFKIALINQAHLMNQEAQNCLLKILEEPKGKAVLILITEYPDMLLPTISSRVQKLRFFSRKKEKTENNPEAVSDFLKIIKSDLAFRFKYAKDLSDAEKSRISDILNAWTFYLRNVLVKKLNNQEFEGKNLFNDYSFKRLAKTISLVQSTKFLLSTTNINPKLAFEALLIEI